MQAQIRALGGSASPLVLMRRNSVAQHSTKDLQFPNHKKHKLERHHVRWLSIDTVIS